LFTCNGGLGHQGRYVYIRDDRRDQDYFGLCEVEVFAYRGKGVSAPPPPQSSFVGIYLLPNENVVEEVNKYQLNYKHNINRMQDNRLPELASSYMHETANRVCPSVCLTLSLPNGAP
jgi:hypothetical protein